MISRHSGEPEPSTFPPRSIDPDTSCGATGLLFCPACNLVQNLPAHETCPYCGYGPEEPLDDIVHRAHDMKRPCRDEGDATRSNGAVDHSTGRYA